MREIKIDKFSLFEYQEKYLESRLESDLSRLYRAMDKLGKLVFRQICREKKLSFPPDRGEDIISNSVNYFIGRYLRDSEFKIQSSFYSLLRRAIWNETFSEKQQKMDEKEQSLDVIPMTMADTQDYRPTVGHYSDFAKSLVKKFKQQIAFYSLFPNEVEPRIFEHLINIIGRPREYYGTYMYTVADEDAAIIESILLILRYALEEGAHVENYKGNPDILRDLLIEELEKGAVYAS